MFSKVVRQGALSGGVSHVLQSSATGVLVLLRHRLQQVLPVVGQGAWVQLQQQEGLGNSCSSSSWDRAWATAGASQPLHLLAVLVNARLHEVHGQHVLGSLGQLASEAADAGAELNDTLAGHAAERRQHLRGIGWARLGASTGTCITIPSILGNAYIQGAMVIQHGSQQELPPA